MIKCKNCRGKFLDYLLTDGVCVTCILNKTPKMNRLKKTMDYLKSIARDGCLKPFAKNNPDAGVKIGIDLARPGGDKSVFSVPISEWNRLVDEKMALKTQLADAAEALRKIECITNSNEYVYKNEVWEDVHKKAQDAYRATQE